MWAPEFISSTYNPCRWTVNEMNPMVTYVTLCPFQKYKWSTFMKLFWLEQVTNTTLFRFINIIIIIWARTIRITVKWNRPTRLINTRSTWDFWFWNRCFITVCPRSYKFGLWLRLFLRFKYCLVAFLWQITNYRLWFWWLLLSKNDLVTFAFNIFFFVK